MLLSLSVDNDNLCALSHGCSHICLFNSSAVCQCPDGLQFQSDSDEICTEPDGYAVIALADKTGETTTTYLELYTRSLNILTEMWAPESSCPGGMCTETVDIVSMAIHLRDDAAIDVYYVQRTDKVCVKHCIVPNCTNLKKTIFLLTASFFSPPLFQRWFTKFS